MKGIFALFRSRFFKLAIILLIIAAIPLTVFVAQQQQENRQNAAESFPPVVVTITKDGVLSTDKVTLVNPQQGLIFKNEDNRDYYARYVEYNEADKENANYCAGFEGGQKVSEGETIFRPGTTMYKEHFSYRKGNCEYLFINSGKPTLKLTVIVPVVPTPTPTSVLGNPDALKAECTMKDGKYVTAVSWSPKIDRNMYYQIGVYEVGSNNKMGVAPTVSVSKGKADDIVFSPIGSTTLYQVWYWKIYQSSSGEIPEDLAKGRLSVTCPTNSPPASTPTLTKGAGGINPTRVPTPNPANVGKCEGDLNFTCGTSGGQNVLRANWNVEGNNTCNVYIRAAGQDVKVNTAPNNSCAGVWSGTELGGNPIKSDGIYQVFVSNGTSCDNEQKKEVRLNCSSAAATNACRNLSPSQVIPPNTTLGDKYQWVADCSKSCVSNSDCPQNASQPQYVSANGSNWCYGFQNSDGTNNQRCTKLTYFANGAPTAPVPTQPSSPAPTSVSSNIPAGDFENRPAKICNTTNQCQNGKLTCAGSACRFAPDNNPSNIIGCAKSELSSSCRISLLSTDPEPAQPSEPPWWCGILANTPLACGSGVSQQTPSGTSGFGFGWFNPFFGK